MQTGKLTALAVAKLRRERKPGLRSDGGGLCVQNGSSWVFRYWRDREDHWMGLGSLIDVTLAEARAEAQEQRKVLRNGMDPIEARKVARAAQKVATVTFRQEAEAYIESHAAGWRGGKSADQWRASLRDHAYPVFGDRPIADIETADVLRALTPIWTTRAVTAGRVRGRVEAILDAAKAHGLRTGENPSRWKGHLENLLPGVKKVARVEHHAAMDYREIAALMAELRRMEGIASKALQFTILTAARSGEVFGARWDEFDLTERTWTIPPSRMKAGQEHRVPLSDAAMAIIESMASIRMSDFIFPGRRQGKPLSHDAMVTALRALRPGGLTVHGFRACFKTWCSEATNTPTEIVEMSLGHTVGGAVERAYRRTDLMEKRRALMGQWATYCDRPGERGEVVQLRAGRLA
jgi:integrase